MYIQDRTAQYVIDGVEFSGVMQLAGRAFEGSSMPESYSVLCKVVIPGHFVWP